MPVRPRKTRKTDRPRLGHRHAVELELHQIERRHAELRIHDEGRRGRLLASLAEVGQQVPVIVVPRADRFVLIDGYLRLEALERLGRDTVEATTWVLSEAEALLQHHHLSGSSHSALEDAWLLARLRDDGLSLDESARRLCRSKSWVSRRLALLRDLGQAVQQRVRQGTIPPQAAMKYLVPLARANRGQCDELVEALGATRVSVRDVAALYQGWRSADAQGRRRLVADPMLYLRALRATAEVDPGDGEMPMLLKDLTVLGAVALRARQRLRRRDRLALEAAYRRSHIRAAWRSADAAFTQLRQAFEEAWPDAGPEHKDDDPQAV